MSYELEQTGGIKRFTRLPLIRKALVALIIFVVISGLKSRTGRITRKVYAFVKNVYLMEVDYQYLVNKFKLNEKIGEGYWIKLWERLQDLKPSIIDKNTTYQGNKEESFWEDLIKQPVIMPCLGEVIAQYGLRIHPVYGDQRVHVGIDIACPEGGKVRTVLKGVVVKVEDSPTYGKTVIVEHRKGLKTFYAHCSKITVKEQKQLEAGDLIAETGSTGLSTSPHLHFEVWKDDVAVDPYSIFTFINGGD